MNGYRWILMLCLASACGTDKVVKTTDDKVFDILSSGSVISTLKPTECSDRDLGWAGGRDGVCSGPWHYTTYDCFRYGRCPSNGIEGYERHQVRKPVECQRPEFGVASFRLAETSSGEKTYISKVGRLKAPRRPEAAVDRLQECERKAIEQCRADLAHRVASLGLPSESYGECVNGREVGFQWQPIAACDPPQNTWKDEHTRCAISSWHFDKRIFAPIYNVGFYNDCFELAWEDDASRPIYRLERTRSAGVESLNVCGAPETHHFCGKGRARSDLDAADRDWWSNRPDAATCVTCDGIGSDSPRAKFTCLQNQLPVVDQFAPPEQALALTNDVITRLKVLFEIHSEDLDQLQRSQAVALFSEYPDTDLCAESLELKGLRSALRQRDTSQIGALALCVRLALPHVSPALANRYYVHCSGIAAALADNMQGANLLPARKAIDSIMQKLAQRVFGVDAT